MKRFCVLAVAALSSAAALAAEEFNGSQPMDCEPTVGHDCLPTEKSCKALKPEAGKQLNLHIDVASMSVKTPYRTSTLPIGAFSFNTKSLIMQGTNLETVWSATIHRTSGKLTLTINDREGAYVIFGQCKIAQPKTGG